MFKFSLFAVLFSCYSFAFSQDTAYARSVINTLSSKAFKGRGYVKKADHKAAKFIANQFKSIGLKPFNKSYFQKVPFSVNTFPSKMKVKYNGKTLIPGVDYIVDPASQSINFKGKIDFVPYNDLQDEKSYDLKYYSKSYVVLDTFNKKYSESAAINFRKFIGDRNKKLIIKLSNEKLTWSSSSFQNQNCIIILKDHVYNRNKSANFEISIVADFKDYYESKNVIGMVPGTIHKDSFIVFTAHYDHLGMMGKNAYFPGANDNASGIAMMLDLAKYFSQNPQKYSIVFIAFTAEETGLIGSHYFVKNPLFPLANIQFLINIDLMGNGLDGAMAVNGAVFKEQFSLLKSINDREKYLPELKVRGKAANSDHYYFSENGVPCFFFYLMGPYPYYHDVFDKSEAVPLINYIGAYNLFKDFAISLIP